MKFDFLFLLIILQGFFVMLSVIATINQIITIYQYNINSLLFSNVILALLQITNP